MQETAIDKLQEALKISEMVLNEPIGIEPADYLRTTVALHQIHKTMEEVLTCCCPSNGLTALVHPIMIGIVWVLLMMAVVEVTLWITSKYHEHKTLELLKEEEE